MISCIARQLARPKSQQMLVTLLRNAAVFQSGAQRNAAIFRSGALKPKPEQMPFGLVGAFCAVVPGLFVGAAISKSVANFLEENDLFVPSDDDDDED